MAKRAGAAHQNALEGFVGFSAAVLAAKAAEADGKEMTKLCFKYLALRCGYLYVFLSTSLSHHTKPKAMSVE
jgi:uncharacterized MAPEG superfamily protein